MEVASYVVKCFIFVPVCFFLRGGFGKELAPAQHRFKTEDVNSFWRNQTRLQAKIDSMGMNSELILDFFLLINENAAPSGACPIRPSLGVVAHSVRAVGLEDIKVC